MSREVRPTRRGTPAAGVAPPADRRFRRSETPPVRRRRIGRTVWGLARWGVIVAALVAIGAWGTERIAASDMFLVRDIAVRGNARLSTADIEALVEGLRGENVFGVDFERYRGQVLDSPWVAHVNLSRVLPSTIVIEIVERTPLAIARLNQQLYLVDQTGKIIGEYGAAHRDLDLPIVDGLLNDARADELAAGADRVELASALLTGLGSRPDLRRRLSEVDVSNPRDAVVMFDDDPTWLHLGDAQFAERLQRYLDLRPALRDRFGTLDYVDLKFDERVYVRGQALQTGRSAGGR